MLSGRSAQPAGEVLERPSQKMFSESLDPQREHSTHKQVGLGDSHPGDDRASPGPRGGDPQGAHTYLSALVKWAHVGKPCSRAEPGGHDHSWAIGGKNLEAIDTNIIIRKEQLVTTYNLFSTK